jgi:hypothetical protein
LIEQPIDGICPAAMVRIASSSWRLAPGAGVAHRAIGLGDRLAFVMEI